MIFPIEFQTEPQAIVIYFLGSLIANEIRLLRVPFAIQLKKYVINHAEISFQDLLLPELLIEPEMIKSPPEVVKSPPEVEMINSVLQSFSRPHLACSAKNEMKSLEYYRMNFRRFTVSLNRPFTTVIRGLFNLKFNPILEPAVFHRITYVNLISNGPYAKTVFRSNHFSSQEGLFRNSSQQVFKD